MKLSHLSISDLLGIAAFSAALAALNHYFERREYRRKAESVRAGLGNQRCARCDGELGSWGGRIDPGDIHFNPGGYWPRISVSCTRCHAEQVFYLNWDGCLLNRDLIFGDLPPRASYT